MGSITIQRRAWCDQDGGLACVYCQTAKYEHSFTQLTRKQFRQNSRFRRRIDFRCRCLKRSPLRGGTVRFQWALLGH
jgi:hypothetical protein